MLTGKRIFITGGAGFIGSNLCGKLLDANEVTVYDNLSRDSLKDKPFRDHANLSIITGDILDTAALSRACVNFNPTHFVHCAAIAGIDTVIKSPVSTLRVNMLGTANALAAAHELGGLERVVCFSTSEVFGQQAFQSSEDTQAVIGTTGVARWTYAVSKLSGEHLAIAYHDEFGLPAVVLRPFNVYGPGQIGEGALSTFIMRAVTTIYGLANTVIRVLNSSSEVEFVRRDYADIELRVPDVRKAEALLGYVAKVDLEAGIARTAVAYSQKG